MRRLNTVVLTISSILLAFSTSAQADFAAANFTSGPTTVGHSGNSATTLGWTFTANTTVTITMLGYYDDGSNGLNEAHDVGIFGSGGNLLVSSTVPSGTGGTLLAGFRYVSISPFVLSAGSYTIGGTIGAQASDPVAYNVSGLSSVSQITIPSGASRYTEAGSYTSLTFPTLAFPASNPYNVYFGPNFQILAVPEPSTGMLMNLGALSLFYFVRYRRKAVAQSRTASEA